MKYLILTATLLLTACVTPDAGCISYGEARLSMPPNVADAGVAWSNWIADTDDRMTGTCR